MPEKTELETLTEIIARAEDLKASILALPPTDQRKNAATKITSAVEWLNMDKRKTEKASA